jgi:hypothetical protein
MKLGIAYSEFGFRRLGTGTTTTSSRSSACCPTTRSTRRTPLGPRARTAICRMPHVGVGSVSRAACCALRVVWFQPLDRPRRPPKGLAPCAVVPPEHSLWTALNANAEDESIPAASPFPAQASSVPAQTWAGPGADVGGSRRRCGASPGADVRRRSREASTYYGDDVLVHYSDWSQQGAPCCARTAARAGTAQAPGTLSTPSAAAFYRRFDTMADSTSMKGNCAHVVVRREHRHFL